MERNMKHLTESMDSKRDMRASVLVFLRTKGLATTMVIAAIVSSFYFLGRMADIHEDEAKVLFDTLTGGAEVSGELAGVACASVLFQDTQVVREITLGYLMDTESGVMVRNLRTNEASRMTEPGVRQEGAMGSTYAYTIEERNDGGQDLLVSLRSNPKDNYLISYQVIEAETGNRQTTNVTVVGGQVTAFETHENIELTASR